MTDRLFGYNAELLHSIIDTRIDDTAKSQQNKNKQHAYINSQNLTIQLIHVRKITLTSLKIAFRKYFLNVVI